ncbi:MAG: fumarylacetoacetate hydrolase family protein [Hyphomicrobiales bacterium]|nr:fumarylacetoacetate hydrolase family protein [Hyphomicrobiales bacterium]
MKFVTLSHCSGNHTHHVGILEGDQVACLTEAGHATSMLEVVGGDASALAKVRAGLAMAPRRALADVKLDAPIRPGKVLCSGINYKGHALENPNAKLPTEPFFFAKLPSSIGGPDTPVEKTDRTQQMDYEVEFAAVSTLQDGSTSGWRFSLPRLISFLSRFMPLEPADIVTTGTPAGVGAFQNPQIFMKAGDAVEIEADGIGLLRTAIVAG